MKLQDQVCTIEQGKRLFELGIMKISAFYHIDNLKLGYEGIKAYSELRSVKDGWGVTDGGLIKYYSAFTFQEIAGILPHVIRDKDNSCWAPFRLYGGMSPDNPNPKFSAEYHTTFNAPIAKAANDNMAIAASDLLIHLLDTGLITSADCNARLTS